LLYFALAQCQREKKGEEKNVINSKKMLNPPTQKVAAGMSVNSLMGDC